MNDCLAEGRGYGLNSRSPLASEAIVRVDRQDPTPS